MNHFYVWHMKRIKQLIIIMIAAFATASFFMYKTCSLFLCFLQKAEQKRYIEETQIQTKSLLPLISAGRDQKAMPILDTLKANGIKDATFFFQLHGRSAIRMSWKESVKTVIRSGAWAMLIKTIRK